jgi:hypothetical protein
MGTLRRMSLEDVDDALSVFAASFEDAWNHYEKDYYPRRALEFDFQQYSREDTKKRIQERNSFLFVVEENGKIAGATIGGILRGNDKEGGLANFFLGLVNVFDDFVRAAEQNHFLRPIDHRPDSIAGGVDIIKLPILGYGVTAGEKKISGKNLPANLFSLFGRESFGKGIQKF